MQDNYYEEVEICPHCDSENVYPMWDVEKSGFIATCYHCGKPIFLCDACMHVDPEEESVLYCNWHPTQYGSSCRRGVIGYKEGVEK